MIRPNVFWPVEGPKPTSAPAPTLMATAYPGISYDEGVPVDTSVPLSQLDLDSRVLLEADIREDFRNKSLMSWIKARRQAFVNISEFHNGNIAHWLSTFEE